MRIRMPVLAASLVAGALAFGATSADADPLIPLNAFFAVDAMTVVIDAPPEAMGEMCFITQGGQVVGGAPLQWGPNVIGVAFTGSGDALIADGPALAAISSGTFDDVWDEE